MKLGASATREAKEVPLNKLHLLLFVSKNRGAVLNPRETARVININKVPFRNRLRFKDGCLLYNT